MKQTLQLKLSQHLTLTPQLQQSIRLLQLSTLELNAEVERMLQENPLLERSEAEEEAARAEEFPLAGPGRVSEPTEHTPPEAADSNAPEARGAHDDAPDPADFTDYSTGSGDGDWGGGGAASSVVWPRAIRLMISTGGSGGSEDDDFYPQQVATNTLRDHLNEQLATIGLPLRDRQIVAALIDALNEDGYLPNPLEEIAELFPQELEIELEELSIALRYVQSFEPAGVGARDCAECLALQLKALPPETPHLADAQKVVDGHLELLANRDFTKLKRLLHLDDAGVRRVRELIRSLNPRPGAAFAKAEANYVIPDVVVRKVRGQWVAALNEAAMPKLRESKEELDKQEAKLSNLIAESADEARVLRQVDRVEAIRASLNKMRTLMLLHERQVLTPEQLVKFKAAYAQWEKDHPRPPRPGTSREMPHKQ